MKAENQTMHIEEVNGQQTVQCLFVQTGPKQYPKVGNVEFLSDPALPYLYYVFSGTAEHYEQFKSIMSQHGVFPAHEVGVVEPGAPVDAAPAEEVEEPVVVTDPGKPESDTLSDPAELEIDDGSQQQQGQTDGTAVSGVDGSGAPNGGQPPAGSGDQSGQGAGGQSEHRGGPAEAPGGAPGGEALSGDVPGTVREEVKPATPAPAAPNNDDPFADL